MKKTINTNTIFVKSMNLFLIENSFNLLFKQCFPSFSINRYLSIILGMLFIVFLIINVSKYRPILANIVIFELIFATLLSLSLIQNNSYLLEISLKCSWVIIFCIPLSVFAFYVNDWDDVLKRILFVTIVCSIISVPNIFLAKINDYYNMALGYSMLPLILIQMRFAFSKKRLWFIVLPQIVLIAFYCSRGPLLCLAIYFVYLFVNSKGSKNANIKKILFVFLLIVGVLNYSIILKTINGVLNAFGIYSRTIEMISNGKIGNNTGRDAVYSLLTPHILDNPLLGLGVAGEIKYISSSPHFVFLEFFLNYGIVFGFMLSAFVLIVILRTLIKTKLKNDIIVLFLCGGFVHLLLSSTYLETPLFWILISVCLSVVRKKTRIKVLMPYEKKENCAAIS